MTMPAQVAAALVNAEVCAGVIPLPSRSVTAYWSELADDTLRPSAAVVALVPSDTSSTTVLDPAVANVRVRLVSLVHPVIVWSKVPLPSRSRRQVSGLPSGSEMLQRSAVVSGLGAAVVDAVNDEIVGACGPATATVVVGAAVVGAAVDGVTTAVVGGAALGGAGGTHPAIIVATSTVTPNNPSLLVM